MGEYGLRGSGLSTEDMFADGRARGFNEVVRGRILAGNYFLLKRHYEEYYGQALKLRRMILEDFLKAWSQVDVLLTPVTLTPPPLYSEFSRADNRTDRHAGLLHSAHQPGRAACPHTPRLPHSLKPPSLGAAGGSLEA